MSNKDLIERLKRVIDATKIFDQDENLWSCGRDEADGSLIAITRGDLTEAVRTIREQAAEIEKLKGLVVRLRRARR